MSFIQNAEEVARNAMGEVDPTLQAKYASVICFLAAFPEAARANRGASAPAIGSKQYIEQNANVFASARKYRAPEAPKTIPDEMVSFILNEYFDILTGVR